MVERRVTDSDDKSTLVANVDAVLVAERHPLGAQTFR
jgi:ureidoglycolate hydrolase